MRQGIVIALGLTLWLGAGSSDAHVELRPEHAPAGETQMFRLVVENERADARTRALDVLLPKGVTVKARGSAAGWRLKVRGSRVALDGPAGKTIGPGSKRSFPITISLPQRPRARLTFKVLQEYDSGEIVRWIGPPGSPEPAPRLRLTASTTAAPSEPATAPAETPDTASSDDDSGGDAWPIVGIGAGAAALLAFVAVFLMRRRRSASR